MDSCNHLAYVRFIKFSVAPESTRVMALTLFAIEWIINQTFEPICIHCYCYFA